jgi:SAM-dependent methyltransferase
VTAPSEEFASYDNGAAWADGPQRVYDRLAEAALARLPDRLDGAKAVDVGAGTGAATRELLRRGCDVVAADMSTSMLAELARQTGGRVPTLVADIRHLALASDAFDVTVAAFVLNHLDRPSDGVRDLVRVTRPGGRVVATTFGADEHPMKAAVDEVLISHGYEHPPWYTSFKRSRIPLTASVDAFTAVGLDGGLTDVTVDAMHVDLSDLPLSATIAYRLGMAHIAPFIATLATARRSAVEAEITSAIQHLPPLRLPMLVLAGRG